MTSFNRDAFDPEAVLKQLTLAEKVALLAGRDFWHTVPVKRGDEYLVPPIRVSDGPNGVRGTRFFSGVAASCLPCSTAIGATWDVELAKGVGLALAEEAKAKGAHVLLAPTVNIQRSPLGGRGFESFSEDPTLSGKIAAAYINGVQQGGVSATIKHFVCNDQEFQRMSMSSEVDERTLREIYLRPFEIAVREANPWAFMTCYNRLNGTHVSEYKDIIDDILRKEWKWDGLVMSDWFGTYSTIEAVEAGLDLEMPGPTRWRGQALIHAVTSQKLPVSKIDERALQVLKLIKKVLPNGVGFDVEEKGNDTPETRAALRETSADTLVLLKNENDILPIKNAKTIAVIGPNAKVAAISGGGSASLKPYYTVTPFEGISALAKEHGAEVVYSAGVYSHKALPLIGNRLRNREGKVGFDVDFFNEDPEKVNGAKPVVSMSETESNCFLMDGVPAEVASEAWIYSSGTFTPEEGETGDWEWGLGVAGAGDLYIDGKKVIDNSTNQTPGELFFYTGTTEEKAVVPMEAGKTYKIELKFTNAHASKQAARAGTTPLMGHGGFRFGAVQALPKDAIKQAAAVAAKADVAVLCVGLNLDWESEGYDRRNMDLPPGSGELIEAVLQANPKTIIVNQSGTPVEMPWASKAPAIVQAWFGGNELGNAIADVLFGKVNPSGKLPLSFPKRIQDSPSYLNFPGENGRVIYGEGVFVGYRYFERIALEPLFAFGHGLSYTTFSISDLKVSSKSASSAADIKVDVSVTVKNTGEVPGKEIVQIYVADPVSTLQRPVKELKAFVKVDLKPGQSKTVSVVLDKTAFSFYNPGNNFLKDTASWVAEKGTFDIIVGPSSSVESARASFELEHTVTWLGL